MLGPSPFWDRVQLAYEFFYHDRSSSSKSEDQPQHARSGIEAPVEFQPGEIAFIEDHGTLVQGFFDFLEWQGLPTMREELVAQDQLKNGQAGRICLVLQRMRDGRYLICYLTSFRQAIYGDRVQSSLGRLFAIAINDTPEFPKGTPSIKVIPKWGGNGFLYALPIPRKNIKRHKTQNVRFMLRHGELERVKKMIIDRVRVFKAHHKEIREEEIRWKRLYADGEPLFQDEHTAHSIVDDMSTANDALTEQRRTKAIASKIDTALGAGEPRDSASTPMFLTRQGSRFKPSERPPLPRIHYLEVNRHWLNIRVLMKSMPTDITYASPFLNATRFYRGVRFMMKHLPIR